MSIISVFATSIHLAHWLPFYANIQAATTADFEVVFSGPIDPTFELPTNFKFIKTAVKPAQALEVARLACASDYLLQAVDDVRWDAGAIDLMLAAVKAEPKVIATCKFHTNGTYQSTAHTDSIFAASVKNPLMPVCGMAAREAWPAADPCFKNQYGETDCYLRMIAAGWKVVLVDAKMNEQTAGSRLWETYGQIDLAHIRELWRNEFGVYCPDKRGIPGTYDLNKIVERDQI